MFDWTHDPHRRFNPLTREWVLVSPHRTDRPWQGQTEENAAAAEPAYDPKCYLCPGNSRAGGIRNLSLDLIFALPAELRRDLESDVRRLCALAPDHVSLYGLTVEASTPLGRWVARAAGIACVAAGAWLLVSLPQ